jgi:hypothetical protein
LNYANATSQSIINISGSHERTLCVDLYEYHEYNFTKAFVYYNPNGGGGGI